MPLVSYLKGSYFVAITHIEQLASQFGESRIIERIKKIANTGNLSKIDNDVLSFADIVSQEKTNTQKLDCILPLPLQKIYIAYGQERL